MDSVAAGLVLCDCPQALPRTKIRSQMESKKNLVFFTSLPEVGGHTSITLSLVNLLRDQFGDILVISKQMPGHGTSREGKVVLRDLGTHVLEIGSESAFANTLSILQSCAIDKRWRRPSVFLAMGMRHFSPALAFVLRPQSSAFYHITHELTPATCRMLNRYAHWFSQLVFISPATHRDFAAKARKGLRSTWAVQPSEMAAVPERGPRTAGSVRFGFVGRLNEAKGSKILLEFARTSAVSCELHIAGGGEFESEFTAQQARNTATGLASVKYWGSFSATERHAFYAKFFPSIDYLVVPTQDQREGIPTVILEARQCGVPVVATDTGGIAAFAMKELGPPEGDIVRLVPKSGVAQHLAAMSSQPPPSENIAPKCKEYYTKHFSNSVLREKWHRLF